MITLDELTALEAKATPGPWTAHACAVEVAGTGRFAGAPLGIAGCGSGIVNGGKTTDNAALIAAARNALPLLIAVARAADDVEPCSCREDNCLRCKLDDALDALKGEA